MTHKQIWTEIAEAFHTPGGEGTKGQQMRACLGLCAAVIFRPPIPKLLYQLSRSNKVGVYWFPTRLHSYHRREYDLIRGDMANLFACMTKKEFNLLLAGTPAQQQDH